MNPYFLTSNIDSVMSPKKSSPININQFKALNNSSLSYHLDDNLLSNSPSHYATFSTNNASNQQSKDTYFLNKQNIHRPILGSNPPANSYGYINQTSSLHQSTNPVESISSLSSNPYPQDDFLISTNKNKRFYISSNNSVASKLSNCSMDSNSVHTNAINSSSNYFKKAATNESLDSASYSNIQNIQNSQNTKNLQNIHVEHLNRTKNMSLDKKLIPSKVQQNMKNKKNLSIDKSVHLDSDSLASSKTPLKNTNLEMLEAYSADENPKPGEIRSIFIEKSKEKSLGIQIECPTMHCTANGKISSPGIFVSCVNEGSLAKKVGLKVGDQLLEICGINMRSANKDAAANVLRQCGQTVNMKVQFNPAKFFNKEQINSKYDETSDLNLEEKVERVTDLDHRQIDERNELEDTLKNFLII